MENKARDKSDRKQQRDGRKWGWEKDCLLKSLRDNSNFKGLSLLFFLSLSPLLSLFLSPPPLGLFCFSLISSLLPFLCRFPALCFYLCHMSCEDLLITAPLYISLALLSVCVVLLLSLLRPSVTASLPLCLCGAACISVRLSVGFLSFSLVSSCLSRFSSPSPSIIWKATRRDREAKRDRENSAETRRDVSQSVALSPLVFFLLLPSQPRWTRRNR